MLSDYLQRTGFRRQLTVISTGAILGLAVFSSLMNSSEASRRMRAYIVEQGQRIAENFARQSTLALLYHAADNAIEGVATTLAFPDVLRVEIADSNHRVLLAQASAAAGLPAATLHPAAVAIPKAKLEQENDAEWLFGAPVFAGQSNETSPFELQQQQKQLLGYVHVSIGKGSAKQLASSLLIGNLMITLSFAAVLLGLMQLLVGHMMRPLYALSGLMGRAEAGEAQLRAALAGPRDVVSMATAFNKMMSVLEEREVELKQSRDAALRAALLKAQFAAMVSHEVRTPLNGVVGMLDILKEMHLNQQQQECVEVAWNSSRALIALINDILDFSKMEAGKMALEETEFDLRKLIEEVIELMARPAQQKGLELGYLLAVDVPERLRGDALRLRQVLLNLIGNAVKFTESGEVAVCVARAGGEAGDSEDGLALRFEVADSGIGMSETALQHVFDSFTQADSSTARKYGGSGLGLAICRQLVELMKGQIGVASIEGQGTKFWFTIVGKTARDPAAAGAGLDPACLERRVLVVESSDIVRRFLHENLTQRGMSCQAVASGALAWPELQRAAHSDHPYGIVIMDSAAADEPGHKLATSIRNDAALASLRVLLLDRYGAPRSADSAAEAILSKPLQLERLLHAMNALVAGKPPRAPSAESAAPASPAPERQWRVLVAEDNRTNQVVAEGMLKMNGCLCELVGNGREAMLAARARRFDLILMDCNMPEMDGYEATAHIRNFEETLGRRTPIIAMTANVQSGEAEKCLSAGMDDYLAKPITLIELRQKLERWLWRPASAGEVSADPAAEEAPLNLLVFDKLRELLGSEIQRAVSPFLEDTPTYLKKLELAVSLGDNESARAMAHAIKGSSGNLGATVLVRLAKEVEQLALEQKIDEIRPLLACLRRAFDAVAENINALSYGSEAGAAGPDAEKTLVLVVDDDRSTRSALRYTLQLEGFRIEEAENGAQALMLLKRIVPDIILMDAMMPVMDGFTACAHLKELPHGRSMPVLMITALEDNLSVERAFAAGASDYIPKPIHFAVLSQRVRRVIDANRAEKRIRHLAYSDVLTGLPNRILFVDEPRLAIEQARKAGESLAVLFLDLDRFKYVNDTLGHDVGDQLLLSVAQRLRRSVRGTDCVARLGGDEFTLVLANVDAAGAAVVVKNICRTLATPFAINGHDIFVTASVGISLYPTDGADVNTLLKHADTAMYRAKKTRTGFQFFEAAMEHLISEHVRLENDLRHALERNELEVYYQAQARLANGNIVGMEALIRWNHPTRGLVSPLEFIPLAEETGLINSIGEWVLRSACEQLQTWRQAGLPPLKVAVNLSVHQLMQKDFASIVEKALTDSGLPPQLLELEITESTLMEHAQDTLEALHRLRSLGIRLSIDDFGTGYSSLAYLKRFPVDIIKIDRSFIRDVCDDVDDAAIVTGIIALAHSLRLEVVAEGVETEAQLCFLREQSCDMMQGYYLSKPVPAAQFIQLLSSKTSLLQ
ncbi:MAG: EAL domain-containing protein [Burkholderiales bacterium]|nr:EAL domain-containing protein [Burkholderiales bacterium]